VASVGEAPEQAPEQAPAKSPLDPAHPAASDSAAK
jgi:hypothetical protein